MVRPASHVRILPATLRIVCMAEVTVLLVSPVSAMQDAYHDDLMTILPIESTLESPTESG